MNEVNEINEVNEVRELISKINDLAILCFECSGCECKSCTALNERMLKIQEYTKQFEKIKPKVKKLVWEKPKHKERYYDKIRFAFIIEDKNKDRFDTPHFSVWYNSKKEGWSWGFSTEGEGRCNSREEGEIICQRYYDNFILSGFEGWEL